MISSSSQRNLTRSAIRIPRGTPPAHPNDATQTPARLRGPAIQVQWNQIEHRMFSFITANWRGRPLTDLRTIIELISATTTQAGLTIQAAHDPNWYPTGTRTTNTELAATPIQPHDWHGEWNYTINAQPNPA
ncbi:MAG: ISAzo13-like element transposase-related protein [Solirubrobacterales bacterium]